MQELLALALEYLRGIWRFRWAAMLVAWVVSLAGWFYVSQMPEKYVATARVHIDTNSVLRPLLRGIAIQPNLGQRISVLSRTMFSRPNLEKLMRMTDLDLQAKSEGEKERILQTLKNGVRLDGDRQNSSLYRVSFKHDDRDTAKRVVQAVLTVFIESTLGEKRTESEGAQEFLEQQIKEYEQRLAEAEQRRADFKRRYAGSLPGQGGGYYSKLEGAKGRLAASELELREAKNRLAQLNSQLATESPEIEAGSNRFYGSELSPLEGRIQALRAELDQLLIKYTDRHPDVRQTEGLIAALEKELEEQFQSDTGPVESGAIMQPNPIYQQIKKLITSTKAEIASLSVRVAEFRKRVEDLQQAIDSIPQIEAQMQQLDRDYNVVQGQYKALIKRRETVRLGEKASESADDVKFRVIDPPFVPAKPTEPNKVILNLAVFVAGLGAGAGVALLLALLRPVFSDRRRLAVATGLPVFGTVTLVRAPEERRKAVVSNLLFGSLVALLLAIYIGFSAEQMLGIDLVGKLKEVRASLL